MRPSKPFCRILCLSDCTASMRSWAIGDKAWDFRFSRLGLKFGLGSLDLGRGEVGTDCSYSTVPCRVCTGKPCRWGFEYFFCKRSEMSAAIVEREPEPTKLQVLYP